MVPPFPWEGLLRIAAMVLAAGAVALRILLPDWWRRCGVRWGAASIAAAVAVGVAGSALGGPRFAWRAMMATFAILVVVAPAILALPIAALVRRLALRGRGAAASPAEAPSVTRRQAIEAVAASVPCAAMALSANAIRVARRPPETPRIVMLYPALPDDLVGLRILQLTDLHLGFDRDLDDLARALDALSATRPDLIAVTGDIADDLALLGPALRMIDGLRPRFGAFACLGNHEYHPGIAQTRRVFDRGPVPLLVDASVQVRVGASRVAVLSVDDPLRSRGNRPYFERAIARSMDGTHDDAFRLLLCHRPEGFEPAADLGVDLVLAGHTHGGQIGVRGRSAFEGVGTARYLWGAYARRRSRLYTSAGFGHWFPYRVGCPAEVPLIELARR